MDLAGIVASSQLKSLIPVDRASSVVYGAAGFLIVLGSTVLVGWSIGSQILVRGLPGTPAMACDTAVSFLLAAFCLHFFQRNQILRTRALGLAIFALGALNLAVRSPAVSIHRLLRTATIAILGPGNLDAACMAPSTAAVFMLFGSAIFLLSWRRLRSTHFWIIATSGALVTGFGLIGILARVMQISKPIWYLDSVVGMSILTAFGACTLGLAVCACFWQRCQLTARPILAAVLTAAGVLVLFGGLNAAVVVTLDAIVANQTDISETAIKTRNFQAIIDATHQAETNQLGFLLTGNPKYLIAFEHSRAELHLGDVPSETLRQTIRLKFRELARCISLNQSGRPQEAIDLIQSGDGMLLTEQIDSEAKTRIDQSRRDRRRRMDDNRQSLERVRSGTFFSYGAACILAGAALLMVVSEIKRRSRVELELRLSENRLEAMNLELRTETDRAEHANRAKSEFLSSVSHEIRTPMNAILGMSDMLWESDLEPAQRQYVEVFRRAGANLLTLINNVLDLSKIESGIFELERVEFNLEEIVDGVMEIVAPKARTKHLSLAARIESGTPTAVVGDPTRLHQVLLNLLGNATKFTDAGEVLLTICSHGSGDEGRLQFNVTDSGIGIPPEKLEIIFQDFTQAESSITRRFGGTGLGLGICQRLVGCMGGTLKVFSVPGRGSTFSFDAKFGVGSGFRPPSGVDLSYEIVGQRVLIVDNNATNRLLFREMCTAWGMDVRDVRDASSAFAAVEEANREAKPFGLAIVDKLLPESDGFVVASRMREISHRLAVIITSSDNRPGDITQCRELGFSAFALKPIRRSELLRLVSQAFGIQSLPTAERWKHADSVNEEQVNDSRRRVLIAEDSEDNRFVLRAYLEPKEYDLTFAENGAEALRAFGIQQFDIVLMDVQMPVMDGLTAIKEIRALEQRGNRTRTPILILTGGALPSDREACETVNANGYLTKPISKIKLLSALQEAQSASSDHAVERYEEVDVPDGVRSLAPGYIQKRKDELSTLRRLFDASDFSAISSISHNIKGTGASYGFPRLSTIAAAMETAARTTDIVRLGASLRELSDYLSRVAIPG